LFRMEIPRRRTSIGKRKKKACKGWSMGGGFSSRVRTGLRRGNVRVRKCQSGGGKCGRTTDGRLEGEEFRGNDRGGEEMSNRVQWEFGKGEKAVVRPEGNDKWVNVMFSFPRGKGDK